MLAITFAILSTGLGLGAGFVSAQSLSLSPNCTTALKGLLTSPDAACLNPSALLSFAVSSQKSIPDTVDNWLTGLCSGGACSNDSLANIVTNVTTGCSTELASLGVSQDESGSIVNIIQQAYPTVRQIVCLKDDNANQLCVTETISNLENVVGKLSLNDLSFFNLFADVKELVASGISNIACTSCIKEAFTIAQQDFSSIVSPAISPLESVCGASFVDGSSPSGISETALSQNFSAQPSSSSRASTFNMAVILLLMLPLFCFLV